MALGERRRSKMKSKTTTTNKQTLWEVNNEYNKPVVFIGAKQQEKGTNK